MRPTLTLAAGGRTVANLLSATEWMLPSPASHVHTISVHPSQSPTSSHEFAFSNLSTSLGNGGGKGVEAGSSRFHVVRDDLLHPLANGNKPRKLDALLPLLRRRGASDIVTCGGCQSAHAAAVVGFNAFVVCSGSLCRMGNQATYTAERRTTGYSHRVAGGNGTVMWADDIIGEDLAVDEDTTDGNGSRRVMIVKEGADSVQGLLGVMRLVDYLSGLPLLRHDEKVHIVVDSGTGTTAVGLALGAVCLGLQWRITAVMLADTLESYMQREKSLVSDFKKLYPGIFHGMVENDTPGSLVQWVERFSPRRFGRVLDGEIAMCHQIAQQTGILVDPMYTLAAWEQAVDLCRRDSEAKVVMIHTGGTLGLFGLAQRYAPQFTTGEQS
ncbi:unnamed protein product [Urochloa humidicola]